MSRKPRAQMKDKGGTVGMVAMIIGAVLGTFVGSRFGGFGASFLGAFIGTFVGLLLGYPISRFIKAILETKYDGRRRRR